ncbi:TonB-dependent receptor [Hyphococcus flavus]|uniref:TonB-dependent receptor n=1 Tax=Hyphococcus flavus TaxID=1866326 RepID=A0AAE9ZJV0_9PROT|nr:TonB-dependent receptor [Hyphococcus flavus]WDI32451.1 TonB-dependent receptor [Hyphococcus flavus]
MSRRATSQVRHSLLAATALTSVTAFAAPAVAQDDGDDDVIVVTGSRIQNANINSSSPVFQVDADEIDTRGVVRVEDLINVLPQAFAAQTSNLANGSNGTSSVDLRNLGPQRTLVLMDGKRLPYSTVIGGAASSASTANLDTIPTALIERVDVVTGGASAVYGSDAVAGVVNFIMKHDFEGFEVDGQVGFFQDGNGGEFENALLDSFGIARPGSVLDGRNVNVSTTFGANTADGRGNVTMFLQYQNQNEVRQAERDYSKCAYGTSSTSPQALGGIVCAGSSTFRRIGLSNSNPNFPAGLHLQEDGTLVPYTGAPDQLFNFAPDNFIQRNNERFNITALARYEVTDDIEAYLDLGFTENTTDSQIAFSGTFFRNFMINCDNPFLQAPVPGGGTLAEAGLGCTPAQVATGLNPDGSFADVNFGGVAGPGYRNVNGNPRSTGTALSTFRAVGGFRGLIADNWAWDVFGQFARTRQNSQSIGDLNFQSVQNAFFAVDDGMGNVVCRGGQTGCLPLNIFSRPGGVDQVTPEVAQSIQGNGFVTGTVEQIVLGGTIGGDLGSSGFQFPWAEDGVQALIGAEYREDRLVRNPDDVSQIPGGLGLTGVGGGTPPLAGEVSVWELFMETNIPLIQGKSFFEEFGINGAYRFSNYSTSSDSTPDNDFETHTFAAGVSWVPVPEVRLRGQFQRAVRAPSIFNLFSAQNTALFNATDPCANQPSNGNMPVATAAQCAFTGVTPAQYGTLPANPAQQLNAVTGGNPFLEPEKSDTYTAGVLLQPSFMNGLTLSVDYFDITVNNAISTIAPNVALTQCLANGDPAFCGLIVRDQDGSLFASPVPPTGSPFQFAGVQATNVNIANFATRGIDLAASYGMDMDMIGLGGWGSMNFNYVSTILMESSSVPVPGVTTTVECKGLYRGNNCVGPIPTYKHRMRTTWQTPWNIDVTATWRYLSEVTLDQGQSTGGAFTPSGNVLDDKLDSANYLDLAMQWYLRENLTLRAGINNVMGRDPELSTQAGTAPGNGDTFPGTYDAAGRFIFFGINVGL